MEEEKKSKLNLMDNIPSYLTLIGIIVSIISIIAVLFAYNILFN